MSTWRRPSPRSSTNAISGWVQEPCRELIGYLRLSFIPTPLPSQMRRHAILGLSHLASVLPPISRCRHLPERVGLSRVTAERQVDTGGLVIPFRTTQSPQSSPHLTRAIALARRESRHTSDSGLQETLRHAQRDCYGLFSNGQPVPAPARACRGVEGSASLRSKTIIPRIFNCPAHLTSAAKPLYCISICLYHDSIRTGS